MDAFSWNTSFLALALLGVAALLTWLASIPLRNVSIVDSLWGVMIALAAWVYALAAPQTGPREALVLLLVTLWMARLSGYITWRNRGHGEDRRYQAIRARNQPHFALKSLYLVFGLQAILAWIIAWPLMAALAGQAPLGWLDALGAALWLFGFSFEAVADQQLARFKADPANAGRVMDRGLWRYSRHPNYFGECCLWWGLWLIALAAGGAWTLISPLLMTLLLLKVSGVALLEQDIGERRPAYRDYVARTSAFFPGPPRAAAALAANTADQKAGAPSHAGVEEARGGSGGGADHGDTVVKPPGTDSRRPPPEPSRAGKVDN